MLILIKSYTLPDFFFVPSNFKTLVHISKVTSIFFFNYSVTNFSVHKILKGLDILLLYRKRRRLKEKHLSLY